MSCHWPLQLRPADEQHLDVTGLGVLLVGRFEQIDDHRGFAQEAGSGS